jgi:GNAT superfamily N-acetyltransferase
MSIAHLVQNAPELVLRKAGAEDLAAIGALIPLSVRHLSHGFYSDLEIASALKYVFGPDTQLVRDGTYYVLEADGELAGCGGWSRRRTLYGGDQKKRGRDPELDPRMDPARIRAFYVSPGWARKGIGARLLNASIAGAAAAGYRRLELMATLPGVPFYLKNGFIADEEVRDVLPDGVGLRFVKMSRATYLN